MHLNLCTHVHVPRTVIRDSEASTHVCVQALREANSSSVRKFAYIRILYKYVLQKNSLTKANDVHSSSVDL